MFSRSFSLSCGRSGNGCGDWEPGSRPWTRTHRRPAARRFRSTCSRGFYAIVRNENISRGFLEPVIQLNVTCQSTVVYIVNDNGRSRVVWRSLCDGLRRTPGFSIDGVSARGTIWRVVGRFPGRKVSADKELVRRCSTTEASNNWRMSRMDNVLSQRNGVQWRNTTRHGPIGDAHQRWEGRCRLRALSSEAKGGAAP